LVEAGIEALDSQAILRGDKANAGSVARVSAPEIESRIIEAIGSLDQNQESQAINPCRHRSRDDVRPAQNAGTPPDDHERFRSRIDRVTLERGVVRIALARKDNEEGEAKVLTIAWAAPSPYRRREIIQGVSARSSSVRPLPTSARRVLIKALHKAHRWLDELLTDSKQTIELIAARESKSERSIRMTLSMAFLSPDLVKAAIEGRLPRGFGLTRLIDLPIAWSDQWAALGLQAPARA
jgi:site-specific DNA recombinase